MSRSKRRYDDDDEDAGSSDAADDHSLSRVSKRSRPSRSPLRESTPLHNNNSNGQGTSRSRRQSLAPIDAASIDDDDDDDEEEDAEAQTSHFLPKMEAFSQSQYNASRAQQDDQDDEDDEMNSQDELENEEQVEQEQMAQIQQMRSQAAHVAEAGVIERIELVNFMCHKRLTVPFGPQTNFIIGHNGSGKSAVLTGITIALGGKAASTNRGSSLKSFVKEGCNAAEVVLWMKNKGPEAFKHDVYGDRIIIERRINADGGGHWKMKNAHNKMVSSKRDELNAYCDHTNIQVDNPMNVLTQDAARQFLSSSNSAEMYDFFLRGTQLKQLSDEYDLISVNVNRIKRTIATKEEALPDLEDATQEAARRYRLVEKQQTQRNRLQTLKNQMVWAQVTEKQRAYEKVLGAGERARLKKAKLEEEIQRLEGKLTELSEKVSEIDARNAGEGTKTQPLNDEREVIKGELKTMRADLKKIQGEESEYSAQYASLSASVDDLTKRIEEETKKLAHGNRERHREHEEARQAAEETRRRCAEEEASIRDELRNGDPKSKELSAKESQATEQRERLRNQLQERELMCQRLVAASRNSIEAFGQGVPQLVAAINNEGRWRRKPVGPIGNHIKLRDAKWTPVLESVIGNTLNAFCVTNHHDRKLLEDLKRRIGCGQVPILTGSDEKFDYTRGEPPSDVLTILRVLDVDDDFVLRKLVNGVHIESSALVEQRVDGDNLVRRNLPNVKFCYSADMFSIKGGAVGSSTQTLNPYRGPPRLSTDVKAKLAEAQAAYNETQQELRDIGKEIEAIQRERNEAQQGVRKARERLQQVSRKQQKAREDLERLDENLRADEPANVAALEHARKESREELEKCREGFAEVQARKEELENKIAPKQARYTELRALIEEAANAYGQQRMELEKAVERRVQCQQESKARASSLVKITEELAKIEEEEEERKNDWMQGEEQALQYTEGERVEASHSHEYYEKEIQAVENLLEEARRQGGGSLEEVVAEYRSRQKALDDANREMDAMKAATRALKSALKRRLDMWQQFRTQIAVRARAMFTHHLSNRGYTGSLNFNHDAQRLSIKVQTDDPMATGGRSGTASKNKDPRSLSGGEKSFSTICLLLSLWGAIGCPIRCLDEFDVFMDAVNRRISMKMIIDESKTSHNVQYVLITPQNMSSTTFGPEVNVQRLNDPERGQGVLAFD